MTVAPDLGTILGDLFDRVRDIEQSLSNPAVVGVFPANMTVTSLTVGGTGGQLINNNAPAPITSPSVSVGAFFNNLYADITWIASATAKSYEIDVAKKLGPGSYDTASIYTTFSPTMRLNNLDANSTYGYRIRANSAIGIQSTPVPTTGYTDFATVGDSTVPAAVTGLTVVSGATSSTVTWNLNTEPDVANAQGYYEVQCSIYSDFHDIVTGQMSSSNIISYTGLSPAVHYYRVRAYDHSGNAGPWSTTVSGTPLSISGGSASDGVAPSTSPTPTITSMVGALYISWAAIANADIVTYRVHLSTVNGFTPDATTLLGSVTGTTFVAKTNAALAPLNYNTIYYIRVVATDLDGAAAAGVQVSGQIVQVGANDITFQARDIGSALSSYVTTAPYLWNVISTVAGTGVAGAAGDGGSATSALLSSPSDCVRDAAGNLYIADTANSKIRIVDTTGVIRVYAGTGGTGNTGNGGQATAAQIGTPYALAIDPATNNLYFSDTTNHVVRVINSSTKVITAVAGTGASGTGGMGVLATTSALNTPKEIYWMAGAPNRLYICDSGNHRIVNYNSSNNFVNLTAGTGVSGWSGDGAAATAAKLASPAGVTCNSLGDIYVSDTGNHVVRKITLATGFITTIAGTANTAGYTGDLGLPTAARLSSPLGITTDGFSQILVADSGNNVVRAVVEGALITTYAGNTTTTNNGDGALANAVILSSPRGVFADSSSNLYITEFGASRIRRVEAPTTSDKFYTVWSTASGAASLKGVCSDASGNLFVADSGLNTVTRIDAVTKVATTYAGNGGGGNYSGDGGLATAATLAGARDVAIDNNGDLIILTSYNIVRVNHNTLIVTSVAGTGVSGTGTFTSGDPASGFAVSGYSVAVDPLSTDIYFTANAGYHVYRVSAGNVYNYGGVVTGSTAEDQPFTTARGFSNQVICFDQNGHLLVTDNRRVRRVNRSTGLVSTFVGSLGVTSNTGDGGLATAATIVPNGVRVDAAGNIYISTNAGTIRKITISTGIINAYAGNASLGAGYNGEYLPRLYAQIDPVSYTIDSTGQLVLVDPNTRRVRRLSPTLTLGGTNGDIRVVQGTGESYQFNGTNWAPLRIGGSSLVNINGQNIAVQTITAAQLLNGTLTAAKMAAGTITAASGVIGSLDASTITTGTLNGSFIAAGTVTATQIATTGLVATAITVGTMSGDRIAANTLDAATIKTSTLSATTITLGTGGRFVIGSPPTNGIYIDNNGITSYKASGITFSLDNAGNALFSGTVSAAAINGSTITGGTINGTNINGSVILSPIPSANTGSYGGSTQIDKYGLRQSNRAVFNIGNPAPQSANVVTKGSTTVVTNTTTASSVAAGSAVRVAALNYKDTTTNAGFINLDIMLSSADIIGGSNVYAMVRFDVMATNNYYSAINTTAIKVTDAAGTTLSTGIDGYYDNNTKGVPLANLMSGYPSPAAFALGQAGAGQSNLGPFTLWKLVSVPTAATKLRLVLPVPFNVAGTPGTPSTIGATIFNVQVELFSDAGGWTVNPIPTQPGRLASSSEYGAAQGNDGAGHSSWNLPAQTAVFGPNADPTISGRLNVASVNMTDDADTSAIGKTWEQLTGSYKVSNMVSFQGGHYDSGTQIWWDGAITIMGFGRTSSFSQNTGKLSLQVPVGQQESVTGWGGASNYVTSVATSTVPSKFNLPNDCSLFYEVPLNNAAGTSYTSNTQWRIVDRVNTFPVPPNWIFICYRDADTGSVHWADGQESTDTWHAITLATNWSNIGGAYAIARYMKRNGITYIEGNITKSIAMTISETFATNALPVGYRPASSLIFPSVLSGTSNPAVRFVVNNVGSLLFTQTTMPATTGLNLGIQCNFPAEV